MGDKLDVVDPHPAALIESLRAFGYDLATALADLADNSLFHKSRNIAIHFHWAGEKSIIALADDGAGMDETTLRDAMRIGSRNPRDTRDPADYGRFGLGLKTASFSQCRRMTVFTRQNGGRVLVRCWDLDHVTDAKKWELLHTPSGSAAKIVDACFPGSMGRLSSGRHWIALSQTPQRRMKPMRTHFCGWPSRWDSTLASCFTE